MVSFVRKISAKKNCEQETQFRKKHLLTFYVLVQFLLTISEEESDNYHRKVSLRVASRVAKQLKT